MASARLSAQAQRLIILRASRGPNYETFPPLNGPGTKGD